MGYKLAGFEVLGNCEIDPKIQAVYKENNHPRFSYLMDIRDFNKREDLPDELYDLDVLDGSPPCSTFSMAGAREESWGKDKVFREGQKKQRLDDLFFDFIETAKKLKPKTIIAENVEGLIRGNARGYVREIAAGFREAGYDVQLFLLDSSTMGVPQKRCRVFFLGRRTDLNLPKINLSFDEPAINFGEVRSKEGIPLKDGLMKQMVSRRRDTDADMGEVSKRERGSGSMFTAVFAKDNKPAPTNTAGGSVIRFCDGMRYTVQDNVNTQTFPQDYNFCGQQAAYICGMSVPPVMMAQVATQVYEQWLKGL